MAKRLLEHDWFVLDRVLDIGGEPLQELGILALVNSSQNRCWGPTSGVH